MTESSVHTHVEGEEDSEEAVSSHDNYSCLLSNCIHLPLLRTLTAGQIHLKNVCLLENVFLCLYIHTLFTLVAEIGTLQKPLPVSQIDKNLLLFRSPDLLLHPDISESNNGVW